MPPAVHTMPFAVPRGEWDETRIQSPRAAWYWTMRAVAGAYLAAAAACPALASATGASSPHEPRMRLHRTPNALTVHYRPVALWELVVACWHCDPNAPGDPLDHYTDGATLSQLADTPGGEERWAWRCHRPGCAATGLHDRRRWAVEAVQLHMQATDHRALLAAHPQPTGETP